MPASSLYTIQYRPGNESVVHDTLTRGFCGAFVSNALKQLHYNLCHPGVSMFLHFVRSKNLPFSVEEVKRMCLGCKICTEL